MKTMMRRKGSATIIVIVMFSITLILAIATMYLTIGQNKNSQNIAKWNEDFYNLDKQAVTAKFEIMEALVEAEKKTIEYMYNREYEKEYSDFLPAYIQNQLYTYYNTNNNIDVKMYTILNRLYLFYAGAYLEEVVNHVSNILLIINEDDGLVYDIEVRCTFTNEDKVTLELTEKVSNINYDIEINGNNEFSYIKNRNDYAKTTSYFISQPLKE